MRGSPTDAGGTGSVDVAAPDYLWFVDLALREMAGIVEQLGDDLANRRPPFRDANSPYAILTHCLGVMEYWGGATVAERPVQRDRAAEFAATGDVSATPAVVDGSGKSIKSCASTTRVSEYSAASGRQWDGEAKGSPTPPPPTVTTPKIGSVGPPPNPEPAAPAPSVARPLPPAAG